MSLFLEIFLYSCLKEYFSPAEETGAIALLCFTLTFLVFPLKDFPHIHLVKEY